MAKNLGHMKTARCVFCEMIRKLNCDVESFFALFDEFLDLCQFVDLEVYCIDSIVEVGG